MRLFAYLKMKNPVLYHGIFGGRMLCGDRINCLKEEYKMDGKAYRAVLYIRPSKEDDDEGISQSIENQKRCLKNM